MLWKFCFVASKIRAVQIRAMENRASRGMPVYVFKKKETKKHVKIQEYNSISRNFLILPSSTGNSSSLPSPTTTASRMVIEDTKQNVEKRPKSK